jgi:hypothetical protein
VSTVPPPTPGVAASPSERLVPTILSRVKGYFHDYLFGEDPTFGVALVPMCLLSMALFTRNPRTNFIFDEQEALLANPYVRAVADHSSKLRWIDAFCRDFWGLPPDRSIGSYRPIPDLVWRVLWACGAREQSPFFHHWINVLLHGANAAILVVIVRKATNDRMVAWLAGFTFVTSGVLTEAVSGVVGIADVLGATGALLAVASLGARISLMPIGVYLATLFGLYSKESALSCVPLVPLCALYTAHLTHPQNPRRFLRAGLAALATFAAFILYVEARRRAFPAPLPRELSVEANLGKPKLAQMYAGLLRWYAQPALPRDALNNPLIDASFPYRVAGALRVYVRGLGQVLLPLHLSGDYSAPQEPIPARLVFPESILGGLAMVGPLAASAYLAFAAARDYAKQRIDRASGWVQGGKIDVRPAVAAALAWIVISYFPVSNIPVVLPTVRAERFWYFPVLATSLLMGLVFAHLFEPDPPIAVPMLGGSLGVKPRPQWRTLLGWALATFYFVFQIIAARMHANDYYDDLTFWDATRHAVPRSAKAHLNYSVMQGARSNLDARLEANRVALELAPQWPMANVYLGDTLCRLHRPFEAWPHYSFGFGLAPNDTSLVALGIQCLWDEKALAGDTNVRKELEALGGQHPGTWLEYLARDTLENGEANGGADPKYRPRGYNEGQKQE